MACIDGVYFYDNRYHSNYPNDSTLHYSLLVSKDGVNIGQHYFAHEDAESQYHFSPSPQTFSYNDSSIYYCRNFDNIVYQLNSKSLNSIYRINLPNPLPYSKIENKTNEWELIKSDYSLGLDNIYRCGKLLHFQFSKDGYLISTLYDLSAKKQIYCGRKMEDKTIDSVPVFRLIDGVYKDAFFGVLSPESIDYAQSKNRDKLPEIFRQYNPETDNPIIAFYEVI